jgi:hypothetical protein
MKTTVLATLSFATFMATPSLLIAATMLFGANASRPNVMGDFLIAAFVEALSSALSSIGFATVTARSAMWRRLATRRAVTIAGVLGLAAWVVTVLVFRLGAALLRATPLATITLFYLLPGVVLGAAALFIAWALPRRPGRLPQG